jgi:hypothetical protein
MERKKVQNFFSDLQSQLQPPTPNLLYRLAWQKTPTNHSAFEKGLEQRKMQDCFTISSSTCFQATFPRAPDIKPFPGLSLAAS